MNLYIRWAIWNVMAEVIVLDINTISLFDDKKAYMTDNTPVCYWRFVSDDDIIRVHGASRTLMFVSGSWTDCGSFVMNVDDDVHVHMELLFQTYQPRVCVYVADTFCEVDNTLVCGWRFEHVKHIIECEVDHQKSWRNVPSLLILLKLNSFIVVVCILDPWSHHDPPSTKEEMYLQEMTPGLKIFF